MTKNDTPSVVIPEVVGAEGQTTPGERRVIITHSYSLEETGPDSIPARYLKAVDMGLIKGDAAAYCGVSATAVRQWEQQADIDWAAGIESQFTEFIGRVRRVRAEAAERNLGTIEDARRLGDWKAAAWLLERQGYSSRPEDAGTTNIGTQIIVRIDSIDAGA